MRRVVVTGMGMVTPLGCGVEATWRRLIAGESGAREVEAFDVSDLPARVACIIPRGDGTNGTYNPSDWMEPKEQRKVDDFIAYAMCAATQAIEDAGCAPQTYEEQIAIGVMIGSGIGGVGGIAETALVLRNEGRAGFRRSSSPDASSTSPPATCRSPMASRGRITLSSPLARPGRMRSATPRA